LDAVLTALGQKVPELGVTGALVFVLVLLLRRESSTEDRHAAELKRINEHHDAELEELRTDVSRERVARRAAEDERDQLRRASDDR
jgi:hypothetical protein